MLLDTWDEKNLYDAYRPAVRRFFLRNKYRARRFKFSDEVVTQLAHLIKDFPNALLYNYQFGLPPYPVTYIEFDIGLFLKELGARTTGELPKYVGTPEDKLVGFMIAHDMIGVMLNADGIPTPFLGGLVYTFQNHMAPLGFRPVDFSQTQMEDGIVVGPDSDRLIGMNRGTPQPPMNLSGLSYTDTQQNKTLYGNDAYMGYLLGSTITNERTTLTNEIVNDLMWRWRIWCDAEFMRVLEKQKKVESVIQCDVGMIRNLMSLLLWLNQPKVHNIVDIPATRGWVKNRKIAYAAHHVVKLREHMSYRSLVKSFAPRRSPRRHEVEAFWRNFEKNTDCFHDWPILPDEKGHFHCRKCKQWRTRVKAYERGDATIGFVTKEYTT